MNFSSNQIGLTQATVYDISTADLAGANSGQRPDLLAKTQAIFRTPDQRLYAANATRSQLVAASVPVTAETNSSTGETGFSIGGQTVNYALQNGSNLVAALGDSITHYGYLGGVNANSLFYNSWGFMTWAMGFSMGSLWCPLVGTYNSATALVNYNRGVSGETSSQLIANGRIQELDALPVKPRFCSVLIGTNDLTALAPTSTQSQIVDAVMKNIITIVAAVRGRGITPVLCTLLPRGNGTAAGWGSLTAGQITKARGALMEINRQIRTFAQTQSNVILADTYYGIVNWASATSDPVASYTGAFAGLATPDYVHPSTPGALLVGKIWWDSVAPFVNPAPRMMAGGGDIYNATDNPFGSVWDSSFAASGGTVGTGTTGNPPLNYTANRESGATSTAVVTQQARTDGKGGNECSFVMTGTDASTFRMYQGTSVLADWANGDAFYMESEATFNAGAAVYYGPDSFVRSTGGSAGSWSLSACGNANGQGGAIPANNTTYTVLLRTPITVINTAIGTPTAASFNAWVRELVGAGGSGTSSSIRRNIRIARYNRSAVGALSF